MRIAKTIFLAAAAGMIFIPAALAHHSYAVFNRKKTEVSVAMVRLLEWKNPHVWLWVLMPGTGGAPKLWGLEATDIGSLNSIPPAVERAGRWITGFDHAARWYGDDAVWATGGGWRAAAVG